MPERVCEVFTLSLLLLLHRLEASKQGKDYHVLKNSKKTIFDGYTGRIQTWFYSSGLRSNINTLPV